jgi:hypothetical protein
MSLVAEQQTALYTHRQSRQFGLAYACSLGRSNLESINEYNLTLFFSLANIPVVPISAPPPHIEAFPALSEPTGSHGIPCKLSPEQCHFLLVLGTSLFPTVQPLFPSRVFYLM